MERKQSVGWLKLNLAMELDYFNSTTNGNSDDRIGMIKALVKRGYDITIYSAVHRRDEGLFNGDFEGRKYLSFLKNVKYKPNKYPKSDILIVEPGPDNMTYSYPYDKSKPFMRWIFECIDKHIGPVIWLHGDPILPIPFRQMAFAKYPWGHKNNGYTNLSMRGEKWVVNSGWSTYDEMFSKKKHYVLLRPKKIDLAVDMYNGSRAGYKDLAEHFEFRHMPVGYEYSFFKDYLVMINPNNFLIYTGGDRSRRKSFREYYNGTGYSTKVTGKWGDDVKESFSGIEFIGWLRNRREIQNFINNSKVCVQIASTKGSLTGCVTARLFEVAAGRCISLIDGSIYRAKDFVPDKWFVVNGKDRALKKYRKISRMSYKDRKKLIYEELNFMRENYTWERSIESIVKVIDECFPDDHLV